MFCSPNVVREFLIQERPFLVCLQETKLSVVSDVLANEILGSDFAYVFLPAVGTAGGVLLGWRHGSAVVSDVTFGRHSVSARVTMEGEGGRSFWMSGVYGPQSFQDKVEFLDELLNFRDGAAGAWCLCGDFNMILSVEDKNNDRLDRRCMARFRAFINQAHLEEIVLVGRRFTWSNGMDQPTLERLDRVFISADWLAMFPNHFLRPLSSDCSDHSPLLLWLDALGTAKRHFRFEAFWAKLPGFADVVAAAWDPTPLHADPFRVLDFKFRNVAKRLRSWSNSQVGSVRVQLALAREAICVFDEEMERRQLQPWESALRRSLKVRVLGLASFSRTLAHQRARVLYLREGDANTRFYHLQSSHRNRRNRISSLDVHGMRLVTEDDKASALFTYFNGIMGTNFERSRRFNLDALGVPVEDLEDLDRLFTEAEVWSVVQQLPSDKAPGPDGFTGLFYKRCWSIIKGDIMHAINAFWAQDARSFHHLNEAFMILLKKKNNLQRSVTIGLSV